MSKSDNVQLFLTRLGYTEAGEVRNNQGRVYTKFVNASKFERFFVDTRGNIRSGATPDNSVPIEIPELNPPAATQVAVVDSAVEKFEKDLETGIANFANHFSSVLNGRLKELNLTPEDVAYTLGKKAKYVEKALLPNPMLTIEEMVSIMHAIDLRMSINVRPAPNANRRN